MRKRYNTPHRSRVVKTRMTEEEYAEFAERLSACNMSQAEFIRQAITGAAIRPIITVSPVNDELLSTVGKLIAEYGKIGGNLNQIARALNEYGTPYNTLSVEVRAAISDLAALKFEVLRKVGDAVGNIQTYQL
ncbi:mobilization protein [Faecalibacterium prausnitzii]|uniref:Mobilization protein n=1 Tax=Faecalibacterium prausnitzii TaxID=853 RepID=A0A2A7AWV3_9FIRM|nr:plasmid mobilization relaxosome protein MobC [Faecalibacterium prausnitzii]PDX81685.1 mobilization protein [Faecalibacterium prausnitzii]PDX83508.1 mobilization protein [Faecalibacterium prausnitzii]